MILFFFEFNFFKNRIIPCFLFSFDHHGLLYYKPEELSLKVNDAQRVILNVTGIKTKYFRPPKAWITEQEKKQLNDRGYKIVLWSLNSKD
jgi:peptidoglycan/xylan/chitin deacetylase (PgdA/CDA1 family)